MRQKSVTAKRCRYSRQPRIPRSWFSSAAIWVTIVFSPGGAVEQSCNRAEQVTEQVARALLGSDVEVDGVQEHLKAQEVQNQWPQDEVEDLGKLPALGARSTGSATCSVPVASTAPASSVMVPVKVPIAVRVPFWLANRWTSKTPSTEPVPSASVPVIGTVSTGAACRGFALAEVGAAMAATAITIIATSRASDLPNDFCPSQSPSFRVGGRGRKPLRCLHGHPNAPEDPPGSDP